MMPPNTRTRWPLYLIAAVCLAICLAGCLFALPGVQKVRNGEGWVRSAVSLRYIGVAVENYHETFGHLPPAVVTTKEGRPLYSWRVALLPFLEEDHLYRRFKLDEPWDSPHNKPLVARTPRCYVPALGGDDPPGLTRYQVFVGPGTAFERPGLTWDDFPDGRAGTILVVEAGEPVPWAKPVDLAYDPEQPLPPLGGVFTRAVPSFLGQRRVAGFVACFADGSTRFVRQDTGEATLRALITRNGGEKVDQSRLK
jgi:hypothetical protein